MDVTCAVDECSIAASYVNSGRPLCRRHQKRWRRTGDPRGVRAGPGEPQAFLASLLSVDVDECIPWPYGKSEGYGAITAGTKTRRAHELICEWVNGPRRPDRPDAAHWCGNRECVNPRHIRWATRSENQLDRVRHAAEKDGAVA